MAHKARSHQWFRAHCRDVYVQRSKQEGYRSRAVYKLQEIDQHIQLIRPGMRILELGASPGSWTQYIVEKLHRQGQMIAVDSLPMTPCGSIHFILGNIEATETQAQIKLYLKGEKIDVLLSDMAPNLSGIKDVDAAKVLHLAELTLDIAYQFLKKGGSLFMKLFHGTGFDAFVREIKKDFQKISIKKPHASRSASKEVYLLGHGFLRSHDCCDVVRK